ncbi:MAG: choice-of-anchor D domain-containing protein [bacterium]|nr:choice-of-anchor D domain-containing protein [bacterium]
MKHRTTIALLFAALSLLLSFGIFTDAGAQAAAPTGVSVSQQEQNVAAFTNVQSSTSPDAPSRQINLAEEIADTNPPTTGVPDMAATPATLNFNDPAGGPASAPQQIAIQNRNATPLVVYSLVRSGTNANDFQLVTPPALPATIAANQTLNVNVAFNPQTAGNKTATLTIVSNDPDTPNTIINLNGVADPAAAGANIVVNPARLVFTDAVGGAASPAQAITITNNGTADLTITNRAIGAHPGDTRAISAPAQFALQAPFANGTVIPAGQSIQLNVALNSNNVAAQGGNAGVKLANLTITSNDPDQANVVVELRGVVLPNFNGGGSEPSLQRVFDALDIPVAVGDNDIASTPIFGNGAANAFPGNQLGEEIQVEQFQRASNAPVTIQPLSAFAVNVAGAPIIRVGWYPIGSPNIRNQIFTVNPNTNGDNNHQSLLPKITGATSFNPGTQPFGLYSFWPPAQFNWTVFSEDPLNTFEPNAAARHKMRVYPLIDINGIVPNAYIVATEEFTQGWDYNDVVYIIRNVQPATIQPGGNINFTNLDWVTLNAQAIPQFAYVNTWLTMHNIANPTTNNPDTVPLDQRPPLLMHGTTTLRITNTGTDPLYITRLQISDLEEFILPNGEAPTVNAPLIIQPSAFYDLNVRFIETMGGRGLRLETLTITSSDPDQPTSVINLAGAFMIYDEGNSEVRPPDVATASGFNVNMGYPFNSTFAARGDEILSFEWRRADPNRPMYVRQLAALHGCCQAEDAFEILNAATAANLGTIRHDNTQGQTLLPLRQVANPGIPVLPTEGVFNPTVPFNLRIAGYRSDICEGVANCIRHALRFWQIRDRSGTLIPNAYLVIQDFIPVQGCEANDAAGICDFNDNMYLVTNIEPVTTVTDVAVAITGPTNPTTNTDLTYTVTASNVSTYQANGVVVTINVPAGYTIVSTTPAQGFCQPPAANVITCNLDNLVGAQQVPITLVVNAANAGSYTTTANITTTSTETVTTNNQATNTVNVVGIATVTNSITIVKQASPEGTTPFQFTTTGTGLSNFTLVDSGAGNTPLDLRINFQPAAAALPAAGWLIDSGQPRANRGNGYTYGWIRQDSLANPVPLDIALNSRDRNRAGIPQELDTIMHMQYGANPANGNTTPAAWQIALPNGVYNVTVSVGDAPNGAGQYDSQHSINVQGTNIINRFQATAANEFRQATTTATVANGFLTIDATGGTNTKINYVRITLANTQTFTNLQAGTYTITETLPQGWGLLSATCTGATATPITNGVSLTLAGNQNVTCTFNNTNAAGPAISLTKAAVTTPINPGAAANFTITITNTGLVNLNTINLADPQCTTGPTRTQAGNGNQILEVGESWVYSCSIAGVTTDVTNTATVTALPVGGGQQVTATNTATVTVNPVPSIDLTKTADNSPVTRGGNAVFTVTALNTGNVPLNPVNVVDAPCTTFVQATNGNGNAALEPNETWTWTCTINNVNGASVTNTANVTATAPNNTTVTDTATATAQIVEPNQPGSITVIKQATPEGATQFAFTSSAANFANFNIVDNGGAAPAPFATRINFQPAAAPVPAGYVVDGGAAYGPRGAGATYGWVTQATLGPNPTPIDVAINTRDRNRGGIAQELDTIMHMQYGGPVANGNATPVAWEYLLPNGVYTVTVSVGDQPTGGGVYDSQHTINVEGIRFIDRFQAAAGNEYRQVTAIVVVADGKLTVDAIGGTNTKINYVHITRVQNPANSYVIPGLGTGAHTITEIVPVGWALTGITCTGANGFNVNQNAVTVNLTSAQNATCTFNNRETPAAIEVVKDAAASPINAGQPAVFNITVRNTGGVDLNTITLTDAPCQAPGATLNQTGNGNGDAILQTTEAWTYTCSIPTTATTAQVNNVAQASGIPQGGTTPIQDDDDAVVVVNPAPGIGLVKDVVAPGTFVAGTPANFTLTVTNRGNVALQVAVNDPQCNPAPALQPGGDANNNNLLDLAETWVYNCAVPTTAANIPSLTNTATVVGTVPNTQTTVQAADDAVAQITPVPAPAIEIVKDPATATVILPAPAVFNITARNIGNVNLNNVVLTDAACQVPGATLNQTANGNGNAVMEVNETWTWTCSIPTTVLGPVNNVANIVATAPNNTQVNDTDDAVVNVVAVPDPEITLVKDADQIIFVGGTANFTITATNSGNVDLTNVVVTDADPRCTLNQTANGNGNAIMEPGEAWTYTCAVANVTANFVNTANVTSVYNGTNITDTDDATVIVQTPGISLDKNAVNATVFIGEAAQFTISVRNTGQGDLTNVVLNDPTCTALNQTGNGNADAILQANEEWTWTCDVANAQTTVTNTATVTANAGATPLTASDTAAVNVQTINASITLIKDAVEAGYFQGQVAQFTIVISNNGNAPLNNVVINDPVCTALNQTSNGNGNATLEVGESWNYTCDVNTAAINGVLNNVATVNATGPVNTPVTATDNASTNIIPVVAGASIFVDKEAVAPTAPTGGTAYFYIVAANNGGVPLNNVQVNDPLCTVTPYTLGNGDAVLDVLEYWVGICQVNNVQADVTNTVNITATYTDQNGQPAQVNGTDQATVTIDNSGAPRVDINIAPAQQTIAAGGTATFTVTVLNNGALPLANAVVTAPNAPDCARTFANLAVGELQTYTCTLGGVSAYTVVGLTVNAAAAGTGAPVADNAGAEVLMSGTSTGTPGNPGNPGGQPVVNPPSQPVPVVNAVDPFITKSVNPPFALPGESVTFTFTVSNPGTVPATNVTATDPMPAEVEVISASAPAGNVSVQGQNVVFTIDTLAPGQSVTVTIESRVRDNVSVPFVINNQVCMQAANQSAQRCAEASILSVNALPRTGETPLWASVLRIVLIGFAGLVVTGGLGLTVSRSLRRR